MTANLVLRKVKVKVEIALGIGNVLTASFFEIWGMIKK